MVRLIPASNQSVARIDRPPEASGRQGSKPPYCMGPDRQAPEGGQPQDGRQVISRSIAALQPNRRNARTHSDKQIAQIAASVRQFGFTNPVLIDEKGAVIAGHGRLAAASHLGWTAVPTITLSGLSNAQKRAYALADNRLAEKAGWDVQILGEELRFLSEIEVDFEVSITGFDTVDIDRLIDGLDGAIDPKADEIPPVETAGPSVCRLGDLWRLGRHHLLCGDALDPASYARLLGGKTAQLVFTDPPYNVAINGHAGGKGRVRHREFVMASGEMSQTEFSAFLIKALSNARTVSADGAILFVCMDWRHSFDLLGAGQQAGLELKNLCVWAKDNGGMGTFYRSQHELVFVFKTGSKPHINNFGLGDTGRYRTNVWNYPGVNTLRPGRLEELAMHPTVKPVALVADAIKDCSHRGGIILDPFAGSGTTLIAAEKTGRTGYGIELDPHYVGIIMRRWEAFSGGTAQHAVTGRTLAETASAQSEAYADLLADGGPGAAQVRHE